MRYYESVATLLLSESLFACQKLKFVLLLNEKNKKKTFVLIITFKQLNYSMYYIHSKISQYHELISQNLSYIKRVM